MLTLGPICSVDPNGLRHRGRRTPRPDPLPLGHGAFTSFRPAVHTHPAHPTYPELDVRRTPFVWLVLTDQNFRFNFMFDFPLSKLYTNALISTSVDLLQSITFELSLVLHNLKLQQAERAAVARARLAA